MAQVKQEIDHKIDQTVKECKESPTKEKPLRKLKNDLPNWKLLVDLCDLIKLV